MNLALPEIKRWCRVSGSDDDALLENLAETAEALVVDFLRRDLNLEFPSGAWPTPCSTAALLLICDLYDNRDADSAAAEPVLPIRVRMLLAPYRDLS